MKKYLIGILIVATFFLAHTAEASTTTIFSSGKINVSGMPSGYTGVVFNTVNPNANVGSVNNGDGPYGPSDYGFGSGGHGGTWSVYIVLNSLTASCTSASACFALADEGWSAAAISSSAFADPPTDLFPPVPPPPPVANGIADMITFADHTFGTTTGFTISEVTNWTIENLLVLFLGSGLALLYNLRYWIVALVIIGAIVSFASYRAFRFFKH